jgi:hypothetical protein
MEIKEMNVHDYANSVVTRTEGFGDNEGVENIATIIAVVLPILSQLPCLKAKTAEQKREWVEDHPRLATVNTMHQLRKNDGLNRRKVSRQQYMRMSEQIINDYLNTTDEDIRLMGIEL